MNLILLVSIYFLNYFGVLHFKKQKKTKVEIELLTDISIMQDFEEDIKS